MVAELLPAEKTPQKRKCTAHCHDGRPCTRDRMRGKSVCYMHGGMSPSGVAHGRFKDGRYCKSIPSRLTETFQTDLHDPDHLVTTSEIALYTARVDDLLARVDSGECGETWNSLRATFSASQKALDKWNRCGETATGLEAKQDFFQAHETIGALIAEGVNDYGAWAEVQNAVEQRRRLAETEMKRLEKAGQYITAEKAMNLMGAVLGLVRRHVTDRKVLQSIQNGIDELATKDWSK